jgi:uncharacterized lipoprotein YmbA
VRDFPWLVLLMRIGVVVRMARRSMSVVLPSPAYVFILVLFALLMSGCSSGGMPYGDDFRLPANAMISMNTQYGSSNPDYLSSSEQ